MNHGVGPAILGWRNCALLDEDEALRDASVDGPPLMILTDVRKKPRRAAIVPVVPETVEGSWDVRDVVLGTRAGSEAKWNLPGVSLGLL